MKNCKIRIEDFLDAIESSRDQGIDIKYVADVMKQDKVCGYGYERKIESKVWRKEKGWIYMIAVNDIVEKIGQTDSSLSSRFSSYQAGTEANRGRGTCSVTNYHVSQRFRAALKNDSDIKIYAAKVPETSTVLEILGEKMVVRNKHAYAYEMKLLELYQRLTKDGSMPSLCRNTSLT